MHSPVCLGASDLEGLVSYEECITAVRDAYRQRGAGAPAKPRTSLTGGGVAGHLKGYLAALPETGSMGGYVYSASFPSTGVRSILPLFDTESGNLLAVINGAAINVVKTGAIGAVGTDALARGDARTVGIIGSGKQARGQLLAHAAVRDVSEFKVYSTTESNRNEFASEMDGEVDGTVEAVSSSEEAVAGSDIVVTATTAPEPVFDGAHLDEGTHVTAIGQYHPDRRELDTETVAGAKYVPDLLERAFQDAGSFLIPMRSGAIPDNHAYAELGAVISGRVPGRRSDSEMTVFDSGGTAIETVAVADLVYRKATKEGLGQTLEL